MATPQTRQEWEQLLRRLRFRPSKGMGQNFLVDPTTVERIVELANLGADDFVLEIGPGLGVLTAWIASRCSQVTAVELDHDLASYLRARFKDNERVSIIERDARWIEPVELGLPEGFKVIANLPYSVGTVIVRRLLERMPLPSSLTIMVQREVAERMTASPPQMSLLGLTTQLSADARVAFIVPPEVFSPSPKVESAVVQLVPRDAASLSPSQRIALFRLATIAFQSKRKTLSNSLANGLGMPKREIEEVLRLAEIAPMRRPQTLDLMDWCRLVDGPLVARDA